MYTMVSFSTMAITKSAKKTNRADQRKQVFNLRRKRALRDAVKEVTKAAAADPKKATELLPTAYKAIDKAAKRGVIKANTAARKKSRLTKFVAKVGEKK